MMATRGRAATPKSSVAVNTIEYKGYIGVIEYDNEAGIFHGEVINLRDVITFQGVCVDELRNALRDSVEDYMEFCAERGEEPKKPFSGNFPLRLNPELHPPALPPAGHLAASDFSPANGQTSSAP